MEVGVVLEHEFHICYSPIGNRDGLEKVPFLRFHPVYEFIKFLPIPRTEFDLEGGYERSDDGK